MKSPEEIACELVDDFWNRGPECTREYAQDKIAAAIREARGDGRKQVLASFIDHLEKTYGQ